MLLYNFCESWSQCGHSQSDQLSFGLIAQLVEVSQRSSKMPKVGQNMSENAFYRLFFTLSGRFVTHVGDQEIQSETGWDNHE